MTITKIIGPMLIAVFFITEVSILCKYVIIKLLLLLNILYQNTQRHSKSVYNSNRTINVISDCIYVQSEVLVGV